MCGNMQAMHLRCERKLQYQAKMFKTLYVSSVSFLKYFVKSLDFKLELLVFKWK